MELADGSPGTPIDEIRLGDHNQELVIRLAANGTCLETEVSVRGHRSASRLVSLRDQTLTALITEELRIRARDAAFERSLGQLCPPDDTLFHRTSRPPADTHVHCLHSPAGRFGRTIAGKLRLFIWP